MALERITAGRSAVQHIASNAPIFAYSGIIWNEFFINLSRKLFFMIKKILFAAMFSGAAFSAQAQSAGFSMTATIAPSPCTMSLGGGGVTDFGSLSRGSFAFTTDIAYIFAEQRVMTMAVICSAPTKFALALTDNRDGTALDGTPQVPSDYNFGLGTYNGRNIGNARFNVGNLQIRTTAGGALRYPGAWLMTTGIAGSNSSWANTWTPFFSNNKSIVFAASVNPTGPEALIEVSGDVYVGVNISKSVLDTATSDIQLDGSGTVTLVLL